MDELIRLVYVSRSTLPEKGDHHIQAINEAILSEAQAFNDANNITGFLCFANNCYFQLIEGPKSTVELLFAKIEKDSRHQNIQLMFKESILQRSFAEWKMKYIKDINIAMPLINLHCHKHFSPYEFAENLCKDLIEFLSEKCTALKA